VGPAADGVTLSLPARALLPAQPPLPLAVQLAASADAHVSVALCPRVRVEDEDCRLTPKRLTDLAQQHRTLD
jgi:hypothetical protein